MFQRRVAAAAVNFTRQQLFRRPGCISSWRSCNQKAFDSHRFAALCGFGAASLLAAKFFVEEKQLTRCDAPVDVNLMTYNVLAPKLAPPSHYPKCSPKDLDKSSRLPKILSQLGDAVKENRIICLQEVDLEWNGELTKFFEKNDYTVVFASYGKEFNGYMGVTVAWPRKHYEAIDIDTCRLSETAPRGVWPKERNGNLNPHGMYTWKGVCEIIGCKPPDFPQLDGEWKLAGSRFNQAIFVKLRPKASPKKSFCVANYHMPCLFGSTEKVRAVNIHSHMLMSKLSKYAKGDPVVLVGDFNIRPGTSSYQLLTEGGNVAELKKTDAYAEVRELDEKLSKTPPFPGGLTSAYKSFHGKEPLFTNFAFSSFNPEPFVETLDYIWFNPERFTVVACKELPKTKEEVNGPFPNLQQPSDHLPLHATLRMK
eukprot:TRINITY_DN2016_c3_g1_i1.p1 TRINITY_DN2016_c3_g1~~TRINITY_DN2016_c3_g1_i1.p1  ORF type:complete len:457 (-),score=95.83 TRINITY_DN2016_c3_g1_i1:162-1433(-)